MLTYNLTRKDNSTTKINVQLLDTDFALEWKNYMLALSKRLPDIGWNLRIGGCKAVHYMDAPVELLQGLYDGFNFLHNNLGLDYTTELSDLKYLIKNPTELRQSHLNTWHRHFTTQSTEWYSGRMPVPTGFTSEDTFKAVNILNQNTHDLERSTYCYLENVNLIKGKWFHFIACTDSKEFKNKDALFGNGAELRLTDRIFNPETNGFHHTVWLSEDIQGKDQIKSWLEHDDLSANDCTGNLFMTPNIMLDPHMIFATVMENPSWTQQHLESGKPVNRFPIGDILDLELIDWLSLIDATVDSVELDSIVIWKNR